MSAYGSSLAQRQASAPLGARIYPLPPAAITKLQQTSAGKENAAPEACDAVAFVHLDGAAVPNSWAEYMHSVFQQELADGLT